MTEMPSYNVENPNFEPTKAKKQYSIYSSFLPILLSIFTYILIFYVLDVSLSSIFNNTKILFFISNALILIISADYGAFSAKENHDLYGEYTAAMRSDARENPSLENFGYETRLAEEIKKGEAQVPEKTIPVVSKNQPRNKLILIHEPATEHNIHIATSNGETCKAIKLVNPKPYGRSKSDKACSERRHQEIKHRPKSYDRSKSEDSSKWMIVHKGEKAHDEAEEKWENVREESEEFAKMSNEELNRRVEDFIHYIKRQNFV